jgi:hypothetical protein
VKAFAPSTINAGGTSTLTVIINETPRHRVASVRTTIRRHQPGFRPQARPARAGWSEHRVEHPLTGGTIAASGNAIPDQRHVRRSRDAQSTPSPSVR